MCIIAYSRDLNLYESRRNYKNIEEKRILFFNQKGSHMQFKHKVNKNKITVPYHSKQDLNINVIKSIEEHTNLKILKKLNKKKNKINKEDL